MNERVSYVADRGDRATWPTARSSVLDAARRFSPSASISDAVRSMPIGSTTPKPACSEGSERPRREHAGPVLGQPGVRDRGAEPANVAAASVTAETRSRLGDDDVEALRLLAQADERGAERQLLDLEAVPAQTLVLDGGAPVARVADGDDAAAARRGARERAADRDRVRPVPHRPGDHEVAGRRHVDARDPPGERRSALTPSNAGSSGEATRIASARR